MRITKTFNCSFIFALAIINPTIAAVDQFDLTLNAAIAGHNIEQLTSVTPEDCAAACTDATRASWCKSFDYHKLSNKCDLSNKNATDVGALKTDYAGNPYDHYSLKVNPLDLFDLTENAAISGHNTEYLSNVTPAECATACADSTRAYWCKSFDYHKNNNACDLSDKQASAVGGLKTNYTGNPYDHYSRQLTSNAPNPIAGKKHILLIGIDGLRGDSIQCAGCASTPNMDLLIAGGAFHNNVIAGGSAQYPQATYSGPGWSSVFTGYWANEHGVTSNSTSLALQKPHVFDLIKQSYPTASVAVVADWVNLVTNLKPGSVDYLVQNSNKNSQQATNQVIDWLTWEHPPTAIFYYLHKVDIHTTSYAPLSSTYQNAITAEDAQIGQVLAALAARENYANEEWLIIVTSDHGGSGSGHGGQTISEKNSFVILNNNYQNPSKSPYCEGDLSNSSLYQIDATTPHILDFLDLPYTVAGNKHSACGQ